jgi:hypothetical protein
MEKQKITTTELKKAREAWEAYLKKNSVTEEEFDKLWNEGYSFTSLNDLLSGNILKEKVWH